MLQVQAVLAINPYPDYAATASPLQFGHLVGSLVSEPEWQLQGDLQEDPILLM